MKRNLNAKYKLNLKLVEKVIGSGITNGGQLDGLARYLFKKSYKGIYLKRDKLPLLRHHGDFAILNEPENIHWIAIFNLNGKLYEFDSYARDMLGSGFRDFNKNNDAIDDQGISQENCGARVVSMMVSLFSK